MTLTETDKRNIAKASELAVLQGTDAFRQRYDETEGDMARAAALGEAQYLLGELAALADRLEAETSRLRIDRARYRTQLRLTPDDEDRAALREAGQPGRLAGN